METYNVVDLRYATNELGAHNFVKEEEYLKLEEENEILRAERTYWHSMYNGEGSAQGNEILTP